jgi:hypothetical protein
MVMGHEAAAPGLTSVPVVPDAMLTEQPLIVKVWAVSPEGVATRIGWVTPNWWTEAMKMQYVEPVQVPDNWAVQLE